jgi:predicted transcriptional regulator of viral defense system
MSIRYPEPNTIGDKVKRVFETHGGVLRFSEAVRLGVRPGTLRDMVEAEQIEQLARGLYKVADDQFLDYPDLVTVARKIPKAVICLVSALNFHDMTTRVPGAIEIMLPRGSHRPILEWPPLEVHYSLPELYDLGKEVHKRDETDITVYSREKTLADCVKYRNTLGIELVIEALRLYSKAKARDVDLLMYYARKCRVGKIMSAYLDGIL